MSNGRSVKEILRLVESLQTSDKHQVATPEGWRPGEKVIVPPPKTADEAEDRLAHGDGDCIDWYFCKRDIGSSTRLKEKNSKR